jgi:hypothetical protein
MGADRCATLPESSSENQWDRINTSAKYCQLRPERVVAIPIKTRKYPAKQTSKFL